MSSYKKNHKTSGLEFIILSLLAFNGSGYADMESVESYINSYIAYNKMKNRSENITMVTEYYDEICLSVDKLLETTSGSGRIPSEKNRVKFMQYYKPNYLL